MHILSLLQALVVPDGAPAWLVLLVTLFPIAAGWLSNLVMDGLKQLIAKLDVAPTVVKQIASVLVAMAVGFISTKLGAVIDPDLHNWTAASVNMLFTVLAQQGIYRWKAANQAAKMGLVYARPRTPAA